MLVVLSMVIGEMLLVLVVLLVAFSWWLVASCLPFHAKDVFAFDGIFVVRSIDLVGFILDLVGFAVPSFLL